MFCLTIAMSCTQATVAGGRSCKTCGCKEHVKAVCRLVKVCEEVEIPEYAHLKREVFQPDKGTVCHTGFRCDTIYDIWREYGSKSKGKGVSPELAFAHQVPQKYGLPPLQSTCHTVCECQTHYGAKPTGCHVGCAVRKAVSEHKVVVPILKWETVHLCEDCCEGK
jgi:hypothetical protein